jgi:hypothetical protein
MIQSPKARDKEAAFAQDKIRENADLQVEAGKSVYGSFEMTPAPRTLVSVDMEGKVTWAEDVTPAEIMRSPYPDRVAILALWYGTHPDQL